MRLYKGPDPDETKVETRIHVAEAKGYRLELIESLVEGRRYFNFTHVANERAR